MSNELSKLLDDVEDEATFVSFIAALSADWEAGQELEKQGASSTLAPGFRGWKNGSIGTFLEAAGAWANVADHPIWGYTKSTNPWRRVADILMAGKHYE